MSDLSNETLEDDYFDTILSPDIDFSGTLSFEKPLLIRGRLSGEINASGLLMIDSEGVVSANIKATEVIVKGSVMGNITAPERITLNSSGKITGNITSPEVSIETGGIFNGLCKMDNIKQR